MTDSTKKGTRRPKKRRRAVSLGGTSQSAFAGYAPKTGGKRPTSKVSSKSEATDADAKPAAEDND